MTKSFKDKLIGYSLGSLFTFTGGILMYWIMKSDAKDLKIEDKLKTDIKIEVKEEIRPELDKKLDTHIFLDYKENQDKKEELILDILKDIQQKQNQQIKRTDDILINLSK